MQFSRGNMRIFTRRMNTHTHQRTKIIDIYHTTCKVREPERKKSDRNKNKMDGWTVLKSHYDHIAST